MAKTTGSDVDKLLDDCLKRHGHGAKTWFDNLSDVGRDVVMKAIARNPAASVLRHVLMDVLGSVSPNDVEYIPSEGTLRRWRRERKGPDKK